MYVSWIRTSIQSGNIYWTKILFTPFKFGVINPINIKITINIIEYREMLTNALSALVNNPFKESFYGKRKEKLMF